MTNPAALKTITKTDLTISHQCEMGDILYRTDAIATTVSELFADLNPNDFEGIGLNLGTIQSLLLQIEKNIEEALMLNEGMEKEWKFPTTKAVKDQ